MERNPGLALVLALGFLAASAYPQELRAAGIEAEVVARALIGEDGLIRDFEIVRSDHAGPAVRPRPVRPRSR